MKQRTDEEIKAKVEELWPEMEWKGGWGSESSRIVRGDGFIDITVAKMYDWDKLQLTFQNINALAEFFDTLKVETQEEINEGGCETCDYGSRYGFVLRVSDGAPFASLNS